MQEIRFIDHIAITVADLGQATEFYANVLAAKVVREYEIDGRVMVKQLHIGSAMINLHQAGHSHPLVAARPTPGGVDICFRWDAPIEVAIARLGDAEVPIIDGPSERHASDGKAGMSVYFRDPDGNLLELLSTVTAVA